MIQPLSSDLFTELTALMSNYSFYPNKSLGQHFIVNQEIIERIVKEAELNEKDAVLEIGAGTGFLTRELQKRCKVIAVEIDGMLVELLGNELPKKNLQIINENFIFAKLPKFNKVVSFPPYTISSKIMNRLFNLKFELALLVFQKEFAEKLTAFPGLVEYNAASVLTQYYFEPKIVCPVPKGSFFPKPKTDSALLRLVSKKRFGRAKNEAAFQLFLKSLFRYGNRNLRKALLLSFPFIKKVMKLNKKTFEKKTEEIKIKEKKVYLLEVKEFVEVFNKLV